VTKCLNLQGIDLNHQDGDSKIPEGEKEVFNPWGGWELQQKVVAGQEPSQKRINPEKNRMHVETHRPPKERKSLSGGFKRQRSSVFGRKEKGGSDKASEQKSRREPRPGVSSLKVLTLKNLGGGIQGKNILRGESRREDVVSRGD